VTISLTWFRLTGLEKIRQLPKFRPPIEPIPTKAQLQEQQQQQQQQHEMQARAAAASAPMAAAPAPMAPPPAPAPLQMPQVQAVMQNQHQATPPRPAARAPSIELEQRPAAEQNGEVARAAMRRMGAPGGGAPDAALPPGVSFTQAMSDHFDHYKRAPSRDSSVDRYTRATRMSRQPSAEAPAAAAPPPAATPLRGRTPFGREGSVDPAKREKPSNGAVIGGDQFPTQPPFEDIIMKKKSLGQDIIPSLANPKRTESLFVNKKEAAPPRAAKVIHTLKLKQLSCLEYCNAC